MKITVSGGLGFIGRKLVERLIKEGHEVKTFDLVDGQDLRNLVQVIEAVDGQDVVFHLAAIADLNWARVHPIETMEINIQGTWNVAYACRLHKAKLYYASTCCVYGNQKVHPVNEETLPNPAEIYACSKLAGENIIRGFHHTYGLEYNFMRFATIYGEGVRPALGVHVFMGQALREKPITVHGDGKQTRTLTYIGDLIDAIMALLKSGKINDVWNLTATREISANDMAGVIKLVTESKSKVVHIPQRIGQTARESVSADKMKKVVGWEAKMDFESGIEKTLKWFLETDQIKNIYQVPK